MFLQRRNTTDPHSIVRVGIVLLGEAGGFSRVKLTTYRQKKTWPPSAYFEFDAANFIKMSHRTCHL